MKDKRCTDCRHEMTCTLTVMHLGRPGSRWKKMAGIDKCEDYKRRWWKFWR